MDPLFLVLGLALSCVSLIYLCSSKRRREDWMTQVSPYRQKARVVSQLSSDLSLEKAVPIEDSAIQDYKDVFPPSRRASLAASTADNLAQQDCAPEVLSHDRTESHTPTVPLTASIDDYDGPIYTPTAFSAEDIKALGEFPNYAALSGVPLPRAYPEFDINRALPRPYRPFRWAYHQTMSLTKMEPDWWLELDKNYVSRIKLRQSLVAQHGKSVLDYLPGSAFASKELMEMCLQFLCARYPQYFSLSVDKTAFHNRILDTVTVLKDEHPLHVLLDNIPEDFAIMLRNPDDGFYYFRAGVICSALGWNVASKLGLQLYEIHSPIPDYKEKMRFSMDRYFARLPTDRPIQRGSWGLEVDQPLFMPPGDPHEAHRARQEPGLALSRVHLRVDWQTLRRLPLSGAVAFGFKALFTPVERLRAEPYVPALVARVLRDGKPGLMRYKSTWHVEHVVRPALEAWAREQEAAGRVQPGWPEATLDESPWFPGWHAAWVREQGFGPAAGPDGGGRG